MSSFHLIMQSLPTDPASLFVLALTAVAIVFIVIVGRSGRADEEHTEES